MVFTMLYFHKKIKKYIKNMEENVIPNDVSIIINRLRLSGKKNLTWKISDNFCWLIISSEIINQQYCTEMGLSSSGYF